MGDEGLGPHGQQRGKQLLAWADLGGGRILCPV